MTQTIPAVKGHKPKVIFAIPIPKGQKPYPQTVASLQASIPLVIAAGWEEGYTQSVGNPYISGARADMTRRALDNLSPRTRYCTNDVIVYIDYDLSWEPQDMVKLLQAEGDVVAGTYRCKIEEEQYMGLISCHDDGTPITREDGCIKTTIVPAGFLKVSLQAIDKFMGDYPELCYGPRYAQSVDLFNHGAHNRLWWGEDYAFSRRWTEKGGEIWIVPNLNLDHHNIYLNDQGVEVHEVYKGNLHEFLLRQPGGSKHGAIQDLSPVLA